MVLKRKVQSILAATLFATAGFWSVPLASAWNGNNNPHNQVTICHATGSSSNPFVQISPNSNGVISGHIGHQDQNDIVPGFSYSSHGSSQHFNGQNTSNENCQNETNKPPTEENKPPVGGRGGDGVVVSTAGVVLGANTVAVGGSGAAVPQTLPDTGMADSLDAFDAVALLTFVGAVFYWRTFITSKLNI